MSSAEYDASLKNLESNTLNPIPKESTNISHGIKSSTSERVEALGVQTNNNTEEQHETCSETEYFTNDMRVLNCAVAEFLLEKLKESEVIPGEIYELQEEMYCEEINEENQEGDEEPHKLFIQELEEKEDLYMHAGIHPTSIITLLNTTHLDDLLLDLSKKNLKRLYAFGAIDKRRAEDITTSMDTNEDFVDFMKEINEGYVSNLEDIIRFHVDESKLPQDLHKIIQSSSEYFTKEKIFEYIGGLLQQIGTVFAEMQIQVESHSEYGRKMEIAKDYTRVGKELLTQLKNLSLNDELKWEIIHQVLYSTVESLAYPSDGQWKKFGISSTNLQKSFEQQIVQGFESDQSINSLKLEINLLELKNRTKTKYEKMYDILNLKYPKEKPVIEQNRKYL